MRPPAVAAAVAAAVACSPETWRIYPGQIPQSSAAAAAPAPSAAAAARAPAAAPPLPAAAAAEAAVGLPAAVLLPAAASVAAAAARLHQQQQQQQGVQQEVPARTGPQADVSNNLHQYLLGRSCQGLASLASNEPFLQEEAVVVDQVGRASWTKVPSCLCVGAEAAPAAAGAPGGV